VTRHRQRSPTFGELVNQERANKNGHADTQAPGAAAEPAAAPAEAPPWPGPLAEEGYHGLAGDIVRAIEPSSEADPVALLVQIMVAFGSIIGRTAHFKAEGDTHFVNEFVVLLGRTAKGRKGSSWGQVRRLLDAAEQQWAEERIQSGLSSGEGVIHAVRDPVMQRQPLKEKGRVTGYQDVEVDPGITDKRLLVYEPEYAGVLKMVERQGNTLSAILRQAWETGTMRTLTKNTPTRATGAHVSLIGHCTIEELRRYLSATETANGFGNRFLWFCVRRSKCLPEGGHPDVAVLEKLQARLVDSIRGARLTGEMHRDAEARAIWHKVYPQLSEGKPGLTGALLARAEAHVMRLAILYALLDASDTVREPHLLAALALWDYSEQSVRYVFGDSLGDPLADDILRLLRGSPKGLTRNAIHEYIGKHIPADKIGRALGMLVEYRLARREERHTPGRPAEWWFPCSR
jgi:hypothetical protein